MRSGDKARADPVGAPAGGPAGGVLRGLDPRLKLAVLVLWSVELALAPALEGALLGLAGSLCLAALAGALADRDFWKRLLAVNSFLVFVWILLPFTVPGRGGSEALLPGLAASREGAALAARISVKALGVTAGALALLRVSSVTELASAARALGAPEKAAALCLLTSRYVAVVGREFGRLRNAMKVRGFSPRMDLHTFRSLANLTGMLLVRGVERAERVRSAMLCRGWTGRFWIRQGYRSRPRDLAFACLSLALSALVAARS
ncbi:MAG: energy-coupling factor transporter transmembrane protein EcfT [Deltaproteobacteria bacterium]|nr:energy-coupling factor transporter transmembrane protein EcfT [Deltaproteobacteria bacterium]